MRTFRHFWHAVLTAVIMWTCVSDAFAGALPLLTRDVSDPILYRIKNTRRTSQSKENYWKMPNGLRGRRGVLHRCNDIGLYACKNVCQGWPCAQCGLHMGRGHGLVYEGI